MWRGVRYALEVVAEGHHGDGTAHVDEYFTRGNGNRLARGVLIKTGGASKNGVCEVSVHVSLLAGAYQSVRVWVRVWVRVCMFLGWVGLCVRAR